MDKFPKRRPLPLLISRTTRRDFLRRAALLGISAPTLAALLSACGESNQSNQSNQTSGGQDAPQASPAAGKPKRGGTITVMGHQEIASLSPDDAGPTVHWVVVTQLFNGMVELDENYKIQPVLAESYDVAPDGLTYTFNLRKGVKFHDGSELTSEDVKYTFDYYRDPKNATLTANDYRGVDSVETPDKFTVVVKMTEPNASFLARGATSFIVPAKYHSQVGEQKFKTEPIGTGAFKVKEWRPAEYTLLEAFDDHFRGRPQVDFFRENVVPEASVRAIALETGEADSSVWSLLPEDNLRLSEAGSFTTFITPGTAVNHFPLNNQKPQLADKSVRQAMMHAIDRQKLIDDIFRGAAVIATSNLTPALEDYYEPDVKEYDYDPEKAKALLDEAGWTVGADGIREKDGQKLSFVCSVISGDQARKPEAEVVQQSLKAVGIDMQIQEAPVAAILDGMRKGEKDAALFNWTYGGSNGDPDASTTLRSDGGDNFSNYKNTQIDQLLDQGIRETDVNKRQEIYKQIQKIVAEEVPFLYMMYWTSYTFFAKRIKGLPESALTSDAIYRKVYEWWIEE